MGRGRAEGTFVSQLINFAWPAASKSSVRKEKEREAAEKGRKRKERGEKRIRRTLEKMFARRKFTWRKFARLRESRLFGK